MISKSFLNSVKLYLFDKKAVDSIKNEIPWYFPFLILVAIYLINSVIQTIQHVFQEAFLEIFLVFLSLPVSIGFIFFFAAVVHVLLKLLGAKESYIQTLKMYSSLAILPGIISLLLFLPLMLLDFESLVDTSEGMILFGTLSFMFIILGIYYMIVNIRSYALSHSLSYIRTTVALVVIPISIALILLLLVLLFGVILYAGF